MKFLNVFLFSGQSYHVARMIRNAIACMTLCCMLSCGQKTKKGVVSNVAKGYSQLVPEHAIDSATLVINNRAVADSEADRQLFQAFFEKFVQAAKKNDEAQLRRMIYFPFQTAMIWTNDDFGYGAADTTGERVWENEFHQCYPNIFYRELRKNLASYRDDELSELTDLGDADYYLRLQKLTDKGSPIFEIYEQWTFTDSTLAGNYFGFVFGKVKGNYKALSYYGKFPGRSISLN